MVDWLEEKMQKSIEVVKENLASVRTGRASPDLLNRISVEYYGSNVPIKQVGSVSVPEPKVIVVQVFDRSAIHAVEKAIQRSDLGLTPNTDGNIIRLILPDLTEERRKDLEKVVRKIAEDGKISLRNLRREASEEIKKREKNKEISEDDKKRRLDSIQKITDEFTGQIDEVLAIKEKELREI